MTQSATFSSYLTLAFWLAVIAVWGAISYKLYKENKAIKEETPTVVTTHYMLTRIEHLQKRLLQLFGLTSALLVIAAISGIYHAFQTPHAVEQQAPPVIMQPLQPPVVKAPRQAEAPPPKNPVSEPEKPARQSTLNAIPAATPLPFSDITEFNEKDSKQQAYLDWLKQRYETWLITYYYLEKCGLTKKHDFDIIITSLERELAQLHTETGSVKDNILMAANGSYNELYSHAPCDDERTKVTKSSYDTYMQQIKPTGTAKTTTEPKTKAQPPEPAGTR